MEKDKSQPSPAQNNKKTKRHLIRKIVIFLLVASIVIIGIFQLIKYDSVKKAISLATTMNPQLFTELYFEDHLSFPDKITIFEENNFEFTIHNLENKDLEYSYEVYIDTDGEKQIILMDSVLIKNNENKTIAADFTIEAPIQRSKVVVNLIGKNQQIFFWIEEE